jgi:hypothetical protein
MYSICGKLSQQKNGSTNQNLKIAKRFSLQIRKGQFLYTCIHNAVKLHVPNSVN